MNNNKVFRSAYVEVYSKHPYCGYKDPHDERPEMNEEMWGDFYRDIAMIVLVRDVE